MYPVCALSWADWLSHMNRYVATMILAMIPLAELRGAIPIANQAFHMPLWRPFIFAVTPAKRPSGLC
jgi:hypothetical protein